MLELSYVREHLEQVEASLRQRGNDLSLEPFRELDELALGVQAAGNLVVLRERATGQATD